MSEFCPVCGQAPCELLAERAAYENSLLVRPVSEYAAERLIEQQARHRAGIAQLERMHERALERQA